MITKFHITKIQAPRIKCYDVECDTFAYFRVSAKEVTSNSCPAHFAKLIDLIILIEKWEKTK
jgi:hypothetical protein